MERLSTWHHAYLQQPRERSEGAESLYTVSTLGHHYLHLTIFRAIIRPFVSTNTSSDEPTNLSLEEQRTVRCFAREGVRTVTTAATDFVKGLQQEHFHMFWPQWSQVAFSSICFFHLKMAMSSMDMEEALTWLRDLQTARREMRLKSNMLPVLRLGLLRIDAIFWKGVDNVLHLQLHVQQALEASLDLSSG